MRNVNKWVEKGRSIIEDSRRDINVLEMREIIGNAARSSIDPAGHWDIVAKAFAFGVAVGYEQHRAEKK